MGLGGSSKTRDFLPGVTVCLPGCTATTLDWSGGQKKSKSLEEVLLWCRMFHNVLHWRCKTHSGYVFCRDKPRHKCGDFIPECCYKMDHWPLPLVVGLEKTWDEKGKKVIAVSQPAAGLEKRQCSMQATFFPTGVQPKILVIFHGTGKRIPQKERDLYTDGVYVFWQKKLWADCHMCLHWDETSLKDHLDEHHVC